MSAQKRVDKEQDEAWSATDMLQSFDKKAITNLIQYLVEEEPKVYRLVLEWLKKKSTKVSGKKNVTVALNDELLMEYWYNAEGIVSELNEYGGGPEEDEMEAAEWLHKISDLKEKGPISTEAKFEFLDEAFVQYNYGNSGLDDVLMDAFFGVCKTKEEWMYLVEKLGERPTEWRQDLIMRIQKEYLKDDEAFLKMRKEDLHYGRDYWDLAEFYIRKKESKKAVEIAEEGLLKGDGRQTELFEFLSDFYAKKRDTTNLERVVQYAIKEESDEKEMLDRLFEYYKARDDYENGKKALLKAFEYVEGAGYIPEVRSYAHYNKMKQFLTETDWKTIEPKIIQKIRERDLEDYLQICLDKGLKKEVVDIVLHPPKKQSNIGFGFDRDYDFDKFANQLEEEFPEDVIEYYWQKAYGDISGGNRNTYHTAAHYLTKVKEIYINVLKDENRWNQRYSDLKTEFNKRPAFLGEVSIIVEGKKRPREYDW